MLIQLRNKITKINHDRETAMFMAMVVVWRFEMRHRKQKMTDASVADWRSLRRVVCVLSRELFVMFDRGASVPAA